MTTTYDEAPIRVAEVTSLASTPETVARYLPDNYRVHVIRGTLVIVGSDNAGWTLDDYVIPRLASGLHAAVEREAVAS